MKMAGGRGDGDAGNRRMDALSRGDSLHLPGADPCVVFKWVGAARSSDASGEENSNS